MENIDLARFNLDNSQLIKDAEEARKKFENLKKEQSDLRKEMRLLQKEGKDSGQEFANLNSKLTTTEASVRDASKEYRSYRDILAGVATQTNELELTQSELDAVLNREINTIQGLRNQNTALNKIRNKANIETEEGRKQIEAVNNRLDENNKRIKENADSYTQQKINIGNYREGVKGAINDLGGLSGMMGNTSNAMGIGLNAVRGLTAGISQMTKAALAFVATPFGAIISVLAIAIGSVVTALSRSEETTNKLMVALAPLQGILDALTDAIAYFGEIIVENIIELLEKASEGFDSLMETIEKALRFLRLEDAADGVRGYSDAVREAQEGAERLVRLNQQIVKSQRNMTIQESAYKRRLEELKNLRDDEENSLEARSEANEKIFELTQQQMNAEAELINLRLMAIEEEIKGGNESAEILDRRTKLVAELIDLETRRDSENRRALRRRNRFNRDAIKIASEERKQIIKNMEEELELFKVKALAQENSYQQRIDVIEKTAEKEREILEKRLENEEISRAKYNAEIIKLELELSDSLQEISDERQDEIIENIKNEVEAYRDKNQEILDSERLLTEERLEQIKENNNLIFEENKKALERQLEDELITRKEYDDKLDQYKKEKQEADEEAEEEKRIQDKEEELEIQQIEFEAEMERLREMGETREQVELEILKKQQQAKKDELEQNRKAGIISEELYNAKIQQLQNQLTQAEIKAEKSKSEAKAKVKEQELQMANEIASSITQIIGEQSNVSKGISAAMALINTYTGVTKAYAQGGIAGFASATKILASGLAQVSNIASTKIPTASGVSFGGSSSSQSENVSSQVIPELQNSEDVNQQNEIEQGMDFDELGSTISEAVEQGAERGTEKGSQTGLVELSENREIQRNTSY